MGGGQPERLADAGDPRPDRERAAGPLVHPNNTRPCGPRWTRLVGAAAAAGKIPILVVYNIPNRDCSGASRVRRAQPHRVPGLDRPGRRGLGGRAATIILEPDVLPIMTNCQSSSQQDRDVRVDGVRRQAAQGGLGQAKVYFDIGHSGWLSASEAASRPWRRTSSTPADGISVNVSNYRSSSTEVAYAKQIISATGISRLQAVIDTSRNGNGPLGSEWCDPAGRAIGTPSTNETGDAKIDAFLWIKLPGEADGCIAGAGQFVPQRAYDLAIAAGPFTPPPTTTAAPTTDASADLRAADHPRPPTSAPPTTARPPTTPPSTLPRPDHLTPAQRRRARPRTRSAASGRAASARPSRSVPAPRRSTVGPCAGRSPVDRASPSCGTAR